MKGKGERKGNERKGKGERKGEKERKGKGKRKGEEGKGKGMKGLIILIIYHKLRTDCRSLFFAIFLRLKLF